MEVRTACSPKDVKGYTTGRLREEFLIQNLFEEGAIRFVYSHIDRIIIGAAVPGKRELTLSSGEELRSEYFLERRELGVINIGGDGVMIVDGRRYEIKTWEGMYVGKGTKEVVFESKGGGEPAKFYFNSCPAHVAYPTVHIRPEGVEEQGVVVIKEENKVEMGCLEDSNHRVINKYIVAGQVQSCQLAMGLTRLFPGSVWNTMPAHTHDRRMEVYLYFGIDEDAFAVHYMGEPEETRHIIVRNQEVVLSPSWSIHSGCGTKAYTFIWGMCGENQDYGDMDPVENRRLR